MSVACGFMTGSAAAGAGDVSPGGMLSPDHGHDPMPDMPDMQPGMTGCGIHCALGCAVFILPAAIPAVPIAMAVTDSLRPGTLKSLAPGITTPPPRMRA